MISMYKIVLNFLNLYMNLFVDIHSMSWDVMGEIDDVIKNSTILIV